MRVPLLSLSAILLVSPVWLVPSAFVNATAICAPTPPLVSLVDTPVETRAVLAARLRVLFSEWKATPPDRTGSRVPAIKAQIDAAVIAYITALLAQRPRPTPQQVQASLDSALATAALQSVFGLSPTAAEAALRSNPQHLAFAVRGSASVSNLYGVAFSLGYGNVFSTRVHAFMPARRSYRAVRTAGDLQGKIEGMIRLQPFASRELRFMIWCLHIGSPQALTTVALYKLSAKGLQILAVQPDVPAARVSLTKGLVIIESHRPALAKGRRTFEYSRTLYRQVPTGLKAVRTERWTEH